jgi:hypothetical protein
VPYVQARRKYGKGGAQYPSEFGERWISGSLAPALLPVILADEAWRIRNGGTLGSAAARTGANLPRGGTGAATRGAGGSFLPVAWARQSRRASAQLRKSIIFCYQYENGPQRRR